MQRHTFTKFLIALSTVFVLAHSASADTINLMWDPNPEQSVVGYKVHVGTQSGSYTQHIDVGPTTTWSFTSATAGQQYCFAITAYASGPVEGPRSNEVCGYSNWPPALTNPGTQNSIIGQADSLQLAGSDPRGDVLTYSATGLPPGITVMASTGYIAGTPTTAGSYSVTARASDGVLTASQTFTWTVTAPDTTAPVVTITGPTSSSTYATTASTLSLGGTASDAVGVTQVSWVNNRGGSGTATGTTTWSAGIALQSGSNLLTVTARDAAGNTSSDTLTVTVNTVDAIAPGIAITTPTTAATLTTLTSPIDLGGTASDNVGVTSVTWTNNRGGSGTASGTTAWSAKKIVLKVGLNVLTVTARDAAGNVQSQTLTVNYDPLRIVSVTADRPAPQKVGTKLTFTVTAAGGTGTYEYQWRVFNGSIWVTKATWNSSNTLVWTPTTPLSTYQVRAVVRSGGKTVMSTMAFPIVP